MKVIKNEPIENEQDGKARRIQFDEISIEALLPIVETRLANAHYHYKRKRGKSKKKQWAEMAIYGSILINLKKQEDGKDQKTKK